MSARVPGVVGICGGLNILDALVSLAGGIAFALLMAGVIALGTLVL